MYSSILLIILFIYIKKYYFNKSNNRVKGFFLIEYLLIIGIAVFIGSSAINSIFKYISPDKINNYAEIINVKYNNGTSEIYEKDEEGKIVRKDKKDLTKEEQIYANQ